MLSGLSRPITMGGGPLLVRSASGVEYESDSLPHILAVLGNEYRRYTGDFPYKHEFRGMDKPNRYTFIDGHVSYGLSDASAYLNRLVRRVKVTWQGRGLPDILTVVTVACAQMRIDKQWIPKPDPDMMTTDAVWTSDKIYLMFMGRAEFPKLEKRDHQRAIAAINHLRKQKGLRKADKALRSKLVEIATRERNQNRVYMHEVGYVACVAAYAAHAPEQYARRERWTEGYNSQWVGEADRVYRFNCEIKITHVIPLPSRQGIRKGDNQPYRYLGFLYKARDVTTGNMYQWVAYERTQPSYVGRLQVGDIAYLEIATIKLHTSHTAKGHKPVKFTEFHGDRLSIRYPYANIR